MELGPALVSKAMPATAERVSDMLITCSVSSRLDAILVEGQL